MHLLTEIEKLADQYYKTWNTYPDVSITPPGFSQEKLYECLKHMVETGDSLLVAYNKIYLKGK